MPDLHPKPVVLVAYELAGEENLGVRYVAQALVDTGFPVAILALNTFSDLGPVALRILALGPDLIGLSMSDNQVAASQLALVTLLRAQAYRGHIVAGGALATVARHELLAKHEGLDAIVRREGEGPIVELARALRSGRSLASVPGVTTRAGDGDAHVECEVMPVARPLREALPTVMGMRVARVMASRGCNGGCSYCGSTAVRRDAVQEARRAGMSLELIRQHGLASQRARPLADFADEVAELYHDRQVRFFRLIDDHILGPDADAALAWLRSLQQELLHRKVERAAFSLMVEPSVVTETVADAMRQLGIVRVLVGVEALTVEGLRALGRNSRILDENRAVVHRLRERGMAVFHNSIFLRPDSTPESIRAELGALPLVPGVTFDLLPLLVFPGTGLYSRLQRDGKLLGGMLGCDYKIAHPIVSLMRSLLHGLMRHLPELTALTLSAFDVASLYALSERCFGKGQGPRQRQELLALIDRVGNLRSSVLAELLQIAESSNSPAEHAQRLMDLVGSTRPRMNALSRELEGHRYRLEGPSQSARGGVRIFASTLMAAGLVAIGPGCGGDIAEGHGVPASGGAHSATASGGARSARGGSAANVGAGGGVQGGTGTVTGSGGTIQSSPAGTSTSLPNPDEYSTNCTRPTLSAISARLASLTRPACSFPTYSCDEYQLRIDAEGQVVDLLWTPASDPIDAAEADVVRACVVKVLAQERYPCLTDGFAWRHSDCRLIL